MKTLDIIGRSKIWFILSGILMLASIVSFLVFGLNLGIDFTGGSLMDVRFEETVEIETVKSSIGALGQDALVQVSDENGFIIRLGVIEEAEHDEILTALSTLGTFEELRFESIGPVIGDELKRASFSAVVILLILIVAYVGWAFRKVAEPVASWKYGMLTIVAALHDVILPVGVFAVLGHVYGFQADTAFVAALLTILGYSINATIVIFDRTRENLTSHRHSDQGFGEIVNK